MPSHYESFGMVALEAMACGIPVVASNVGGLVSTVVHGRTGFLVPAGDWQAFGQAIIRLLASPALREAYGRAGLERVHTFAWPRIAEYNIQLYRRLLRQKKVRSQQLAADGQPLFSSS
jgi:D-inositol-3-phosphate glycosyltransferase